MQEYGENCTIGSFIIVPLNKVDLGYQLEEALMAPVICMTETKTRTEF